MTGNAGGPSPNGLPDRIAARAESDSTTPALIVADTGRTWTFHELSTGPVAALAAGLSAVGTSPGDHVGTVVEPGVEMAQLVHAVARVGAVFVPLPPDAPPTVVAERAAAADVDCIVADARSSATGRERFEGPVHALASLESAGDDGPSSVEPYSWAFDAVRWLVFTSGTSGGPKPVALTAGNLHASATASAERLGVEPGDRWLACLPTHHVGGLAPFVRTALSGTTAVVQSGFDVEATTRALSVHDVTGVSLVPTMLSRLLDDGWSPPDTLRFVLLGGAPAKAALIDRCEAAGVPVHPTYGMTETASQIATARPAEAFAHPGTVGRPLSETTVTVLGDHGEPVPDGAPGALRVDGPTVAAGYYGDPVATAAAFTDRGFHTGDRGRLENDRLWVLGRADDTILTGGETVHPGEVRAALRSFPAVTDAAVVGVDDPEWGEIVAALVVAAADAEPNGTALREHCRERLEPAAVPKLIVIADGLPRTASGTVDRGAVARRLAGSHDRDRGRGRDA